MIINAILCCCFLLIHNAAAGNDKGPNEKEHPIFERCLTGYMTDLQTWVDELGEFTAHVDLKTTIDLSGKLNVMRRLELELTLDKTPREQPVKSLSLAKCRLTRVPSVFHVTDNMGRRLSDTLEYITLYGNNFGMSDAERELYDVLINATDIREFAIARQQQLRKLSTWSTGFHLPFRNLKELDLRACSIQVVGDYTFQKMPELRKLYLSENNIFHIEENAFKSMFKLKHLDLSRNYAYDDSGTLEEMFFESDVFKGLKVESVDFSFTRFGQRNVRLLGSIGKNLKRLSLCYSGLGRLRDDSFNNTSLKFLDVSGNTEALCSQYALRGLETHLEVLYADGVSMKNMDGFMNFSRLEILKLSNNEINVVPQDVAKSMTNLQILDLDNNRMTSWFNNTFLPMRNLKLLSLKNNNINVISREMYYDMEKLSYLGLAGNFLVCNCHARDIFEVASNNEMYFNNTYLAPAGDNIRDFVSFHTGFMDFNDVIRRRRNITRFCEQRKGCNVKFNNDVIGNYVLLDYDEYSNQYQCLLVSEGIKTTLYNLPGCTLNNRDIDVEVELSESWNKYYLLLIPAMLVPVILCAYFFRKNFKYFLITIRNSATLSLINKYDSSDVENLFNYDVFVSYCNEDRAWVLDNLLPHVEKDCNISVCLHERDFQVGLSILENIVSCMDRSRMIMLIISKRFLLSQWCQFEMHLAQHRLLETRREDLILVLLEEIPRRLRPNTLHYLMLTKTYIVWPKQESEQSLFWKRMKKSLVTHKLKQAENVSLA